jgi:hypothetical protein
VFIFTAIPVSTEMAVFVFKTIDGSIETPSPRLRGRLNSHGDGGT